MSYHSQVYFQNTGILESESWWIDKKQSYRHREDGPAFIKYDGNGTIRALKWVQHGIIHREGGPAHITYDSDGHARIKEWVIDGIGHREDGPAFIKFDINDELTFSEWTINGIAHREDGPVYMGTYTCNDDYALCGEECSKEVWEELIELKRYIIKTQDRNLAILHSKHKYTYIRKACESVLNEKI